VVRALKGLEDALPVSAVDPDYVPHGWRFTGAAGTTLDRANGCRYLHEVYRLARPDYTGRVTVPVLWDTQTRTIVNNESSEIIRMLNREFDAFAARAFPDLYPAELRAEIDAVNERVYRTVNNGVYRAGFATAQDKYDEAVTALFESLDWLEARLASRRWLCGDRFTEADVRLWTTLVRFDAVYYGHFKCNLRRLVDYPALWGYTRDIYALPGVAATVDIAQIKAHYYISQVKVNPTRIVPMGPVLDFGAPHDRARFGPAPK
jgi:putative glutathione S-transferase